jgi:hypothetical protein
MGNRLSYSYIHERGASNFRDLRYLRIGFFLASKEFSADTSGLNIDPGPAGVLSGTLRGK